MSIVVYYLRVSASPSQAHDLIFTPCCENFFGTEMIMALARIGELRKQADVRHVVMSSEPVEMVGKLGVDSIVDGRTPDGHVYDWSKAGRAGKTRRR